MLTIQRRKQVTDEASVEYGASTGAEHNQRVRDARHYSYTDGDLDWRGGEGLRTGAIVAIEDSSFVLYK